MSKKRNPSAKSLKLAKLLELLLNKNHFIASRPSPNGAERYCVYSPDMSPLMMLSKADKKSIDIILIRKDDKWIVSRSLIRSLHGGNGLKKAYRSYKEKGGINMPTSNPTEAEVYICLNCKQYDTQNVVCKNCGYKSFGETHPSNNIVLVNTAEVSKEEEDIEKKWRTRLNILKENRAIDVDWEQEVYDQLIKQNAEFIRDLRKQKEQDRALISELLVALKAVSDCDNKLNIYTDRQLVNFCKEVSKVAITKAEKLLAQPETSKNVIKKIINHDTE